MRFLSTLLVGLVAIAGCSALELDYVPHKSLQSIPRGWQLHSESAPADRVLPFRIAVKQSETGVSELQSYVLEHSSNPDSPLFGQHLTKTQVNKMVAPPGHRVQAVVEWLNHHGIHELQHSEGSDYIKFNAPVHVANQLLNTQYKVFKHDAGAMIIGTDTYQLPQHLHEHIEYITPSIHFGTHKPNSIKATTVDAAGTPTPLRRLQQLTTPSVTGTVKQTLSGAIPPYVIPSNPITFPTGTDLQLGGAVDYNACSVVTTPHCLRQLYGFDTYQPQQTQVNSVAVVEYLAQYAENINLIAALQNFTVPYFGYQSQFATFTVENNGAVPGVNAQTELLEGIEADLDVQVAVQLAYPTNVYFYSVNPDPTSDDDLGLFDLDDWLETVVGQPNVPQVISTSYGNAEENTEYDYTNRVCNEFLELGAQGISILFSSGDSGVSSSSGCLSTDGVSFNPDFPASCPYVTSVGATKINSAGTEYAVFEPTIAPTYTSGGGFSNFFPTPSYQQSAVSTYLTKYNNPATVPYFNSKGRGFPDISAIGAITYPTYISNFAAEGCLNGPGVTNCETPSGTPVLALIGGTSLSSPIFASVIALVNDYRINQGKSSLGFLNPAIYAAPATTFNDISNGFNYGCGPNTLLGFNATKGWDPATGRGTPIFSQFISYFGGLGRTAPVYGTPYPKQDFVSNDNYACENNDNCTPPPATTIAAATTAPATTKPVTTAAATTPAPTAATGSQYLCSPGAALTGISGTPGVTTSADGSTSLTLVTITNPGVALTGLTGCCLVGSTQTCVVQGGIPAA